MKDSYSFDVDDAGLDRSYAAHREAYIKIFDRLGPGLRDRLGDVRGDGRLEERGVPAPDRDRRGHLRPLARRLRGQRRGGAPPSSRTRSRSTGCPPRTSRTPPTPRPSRRWSRWPSELFPDAGYTAASTLKNVVVTLVHPDGTREPLVIGLPGDREVDAKRLEAQVAPAEVEPFTDFDGHPALVKGYIGPQVLGQRERVEDPLPGRPARGPRHPLDHRRQRARQARLRPRRRPGLHLGRRHRGRRGARRRPGARRLRARWSSPAASRWATSSSSAASTPRRSTSRCSTRTASSSPSPWAPTASASPAPSRPSPSPTTTSSGLVWPREVAPGRRARRRHRQGRRGLRGGRGAGRASWSTPGSPCSTTTGRRSRRA